MSTVEKLLITSSGARFFHWPKKLQISGPRDSVFINTHFVSNNKRVKSYDGGFIRRLLKQVISCVTWNRFNLNVTMFYDDICKQVTSCITGKGLHFNVLTLQLTSLNETLRV
jgi:hypothetical protein